MHFPVRPLAAADARAKQRLRRPALPRCNELFRGVRTLNSCADRIFQPAYRREGGVEATGLVIEQSGNRETGELKTRGTAGFQLPIANYPITNIPPLEPSPRLTTPRDSRCQ